MHPERPQKVFFEQTGRQTMRPADQSETIAPSDDRAKFHQNKCRGNRADIICDIYESNVRE
ncbi:hypothetical protein J6590_041249 [Homalodisca vitripennis]|nr:hypothetical protein J6590_041249 [Homalodisca vitripennis]